MDTRTYRAFTMAQALAAVRSDLGTDAVVLTTRSFKRGGFLGIGRRTIIEVTATRNSGQSKRQSASTKTTPARSARQSQATQACQGQNKPPVADSSVRREQLAVELLEELQRREKATPPATTEVKLPTSEREPEHARPAARRSTPSQHQVARPEKRTRPARSQVAPAARDSAEPAAPSQAEPVARRFVVADSRPAQPERSHSASAAVTSVAPQAAPSDVGAMQRELTAIRSMVGRVLHATSAPTTAPPSTDVPQQLFDTYLHLISQDLAEDIADQVVTAVRDGLSSDDLAKPEVVRAAIEAQLASCIPVAECPVALKSPDDRPLTIALVGPTGVGKTTTLAKLAASFKLRHDRRVGLITCDTYRIAAVDQLRTYANIIGLPLEVVLTPSEMPRAMHALADCEVILIDTAGRSQRDTDRLVELRAFLEQAQPHEVHLVLSSTASEKVLMQEAEAFSTVGVQKVVLTKLDEAVSFGMLVNVIRRIGRELSFFTTGQEVPDHIEIGRADRLAALMLAAE